MLSEPLLADPPLEVRRADSRERRAQQWTNLARWLARFGVESPNEAEVVVYLFAQAHLANAVFALGRNIGPVIFMHEVGAEGLTSVMFLSGVAVMGSSPLYSRLSRGKRAARVNRALVFFFVVTILVFSLPLLMPANLRAPGWLRAPTAYAIFLAEDLLTMLLMMQSASLAQASLTTYSAKRLLGLIQLGSSTGAMTAGLAAGPLAKLIGPVSMVFVQVGSCTKIPP
jgi:hypothetical protein